MRVLVLDLATVTGWCFGTGTGQVEHGSHRLPSTGEDIGRFLAAFREWMGEITARFDPDEVVFESPIMPGTTNINTCRKLYALAALTELICHDARVRCTEANLMDIRRHFIGVCRAPKDLKDGRRAWLKDAVTAECRRRGLKPVDDNAADALALFSCAMTRRVPGFVLAGDELSRAA